MMFDPISPKRPLRLSDAEAKAPKSLPRGDALKDALAKELDKLRKLQDVFYADHGRALLVVLQGRDAAGKDGAIRRVFSACNPQGVEVTSFKTPTPPELAHDYLWRVHQRTPAKGTIGIFNRSHYEDVLIVRVRELVPEAVWKKRYDQINAFERTLADSGTVIVKFFLHISKDKQREEFLERLTDPEKNWKFNPGDLEVRECWDDYTKAYRDALRKCSSRWAPWYLIPSDSRSARDYLIAKIVNETLEGMDLRYPRATKEVLAMADKLK
jgi:PPK2 family polyphosphate:nucleotide phosphotransferase